MVWENFREFVEILHFIKKNYGATFTISEEAKRNGDVDDNIEICIEISHINLEEALKTGEE